MKKVILIPFVLLCMMLFTTPVFAMKNEPDNFRGIPWGAPLPKNNLFGKNKWGLRYFISDEYYRDEEVSIGGAKISSPITYTFHDKLGFARAKVLFKGQENYDLIRRVCVESWGEPDKEERTKNEVIDGLYSFWFGERISVQFDYEFGSFKSGELSLYLNNYFETVLKESMQRIQKNKGL